MTFTFKLSMRLALMKAPRVLSTPTRRAFARVVPSIPTTMPDVYQERPFLGGSV
jgi:hypothetical protein